MRLDYIRHEVRRYLDEIEYSYRDITVMYINRQIRIDVIDDITLYYDLEYSDEEIIDAICSKIVNIEMCDIILDEVFGE